MSNSPNSVAAGSGGIGFFGLLTILFIALKLIGVIGWSWWWVLSPVLIPWAIFLGLLILAGILWLFFGGKPSGKNRSFYW